MKHPLPTRTLPSRPDLGQLKRQAKELLAAYLSKEPNAVAEVTRFFHEPDPANFALHHAQLVLARSYGYDSWPGIKAYVDGVTIRRLVEAVRANDIAEVTSILNVRPELVATVEAWNHEFTALHYAVFARMPEMVRVLMKAGADPHAGISPLNDATSALTIAVERGYDEIAAILRDEYQRRKASRSSLVDLPAGLRRALQSGDEDAAISILESQPGLIRIELPGSGWSLLHAASALLFRRLALGSLDRGVDVNIRAADGSIPLDVVGQRCGAAGREEDFAAMIALLRERGAQLTPRSAVILGDIAYLHARHAEGALLTPQDDQGWLLRLAVDNDRPGILALLLDFGLDPDARARVDGLDEIAFTWGMPFYQCARYGKHAMARMLLERGADPNAPVYASGTPLSEAFGQRDDDMVALLVEHGGKPNPSMAGFYRRKDLALRLLVEHGDAVLPDDGFGSGSVAEQLVGAAARGGDPDILRIALDRIDWPRGDQRWYGALGAPLEMWNHWIGPWCHHEWDRGTYLTCFRMILDRLGPPLRQGRLGASILHSIVTAGDHLTIGERTAFAIAALDAGARLDLRDELLKSTPLGWACRWNRHDLARLYLERGADPIEADAEPWATPLAWAEKRGYSDLVRLFGRA